MIGMLGINVQVDVRMNRTEIHNTLEVKAFCPEENRGEKGNDH
jgi:hypothetical protein